jgi:hypothetical protein
MALRGARGQARHRGACQLQAGMRQPLDLGGIVADEQHDPLPPAAGT